MGQITVTTYENIEMIERACLEKARLLAHTPRDSYNIYQSRLIKILFDVADHADNDGSQSPDASEGMFRGDKDNR